LHQWALTVTRPGGQFPPRIGLKRNNTPRTDSRGEGQLFREMFSPISVTMFLENLRHPDPGNRIYADIFLGFVPYSGCQRESEVRHERAFLLKKRCWPGRGAPGAYRPPGCRGSRRGLRPPVRSRSAPRLRPPGLQRPRGVPKHRKRFRQPR